jgi:hypothetical protein
MRALSYLIALILVFAGPSLGSPADGDLPGIGTFSYCGTPLHTPPIEVVAALNRQASLWPDQ